MEYGKYANLITHKTEAYGVSFLVLFVLFVIALEFYELEHINLAETLFMVYASGFCLEKLAAMQVSLFIFLSEVYLGPFEPLGAWVAW